MYCKKCGFDLKEGTTICPFCNQDQTKEVEKIVEEVKTEEKPQPAYNNFDGNRFEAPKEEKPVYPEYTPYGQKEEIPTGLTKLGYVDLHTKWWHHLIIALCGYGAVMVLGNILATIFVYLFHYSKDAENAAALSSMISSLAEVIAEGIVIVVLAIIFRKNLKKLFSNFKKGNTWKWFGICFGGMYVANLIYSFILTVANLNSSSTNQDSVTSMVTSTPFLGFMFVVIVAPLFEELVFRFGIFRTFATTNNKKAEVAGLIVTTLIFAFVHLIATFQEVFSTGDWSVLVNDLPTLPSYLIGAFFLTFAYYKSKNLGTNMLMHICWNLMSYCSIWLQLLLNSGEAAELIRIFIR